MELKKKNVNKYLIIFLFTHLFIWTLVPSISNTNLKHSKETIRSGSAKLFDNKDYHPLWLKCDSILNKIPYFSLVIDSSGKERFQLIIDVDSESDRIVRYPYSYNIYNDLLKVYLSDKNYFNRIELIFEDKGLIKTSCEKIIL